MSNPISRLGAILLVAACASSALASAEKPADLAKNGGFEEGKKYWFTWTPHHPELVFVDDTLSTEGKNSVKMDGSGAGDLFINANQVIELKPDTKYILRADIRRTAPSGAIYVTVIWPTFDKDGKKREVFQRVGLNGQKTNEWETFETTFVTPKEPLKDVRLNVFNVGSGAVAWYDNIHLTEVPPLACSACGYKVGEVDNYCSNCGAKLAGKL